MKRVRRRLGTALIVIGGVFLVYGAAVYFWRDPVTDLYARWKQHQLAGQLEESFREVRATLALPSTEGSDPEAASASTEEASDPTWPEVERAVREAARKVFARLEPGQPLGRLIVPRLGIDPIFVNGTRWGADLSRGPGRYPETSLPGLGETTAIAGHRTTFGAPFRKIDKLKAGDEVILEMAYGTFVYRVTGHEIVADDDWSVIRQRGVDTLVLSACHPLYSASHRWIVYARLAKVETPEGAFYTLSPARQVAAPASAG